VKKAATAVGIAVALGGILFGSLLEGSKIQAFWNLPAMVIVLVGTFGATLASQGLDPIKRIPRLYKIAFNAPEEPVQERIALMVSLATRARRDGLLALDE
jgi:chemotaxis protein MotA